MQDRPCRHVRVIKHKEAAFPCIEMLVGLCTEGTDIAECADGLAAPRCTQRMGAILKQFQAQFPAGRQHLIHVGKVAAHVGEQQHICSARAGFRA